MNNSVSYKIINIDSLTKIIKLAMELNIEIHDDFVLSKFIQKKNFIVTFYFNQFDSEPMSTTPDELVEMNDFLTINENNYETDLLDYSLFVKVLELRNKYRKNFPLEDLDCIFKVQNSDRESIINKLENIGLFEYPEEVKSHQKNYSYISINTKSETGTHPKKYYLNDEDYRFDVRRNHPKSSIHLVNDVLDAISILDLELI